LTPRNRSRNRVLLLALLVGIVSFVVTRQRSRQVPPQGDEPGWITSGYYHTELVLQGDWRLQRWSNPELQSWGSKNMQLGKWLLGVPLEVYELRTGRRFYGFYDFNRSLAENVQAGNIPPEDILAVARGVSCVFAAFTCVGIFLMGWYAQDEWTGLLAAALTLAVPPYAKWSATALTDGFYVCFLVWGALAGWLFLRAATGRSAWKLAALCGLLAGLACSVKITGIVVGGGVFAACLAYRWAVGGLKRRELAWCALVFVCLSLVVTYGLNPYLWPTMKEPAAVEWRRFPSMFLRWKHFMEEQKARGLAEWTENRWLQIHRELLVRLTPFGAEGPLVLGSLIWLGLRLRRSIRKREVDPWAVPAAFFLVNYLFILFFMVLAWHRYYLTTLVAMQVPVAGVLVAAATWLARRRRLASGSP
jgi:4-amino-4-deoxy-L-arabinose transferase-like glycosyltransferase